MATKQLGIETDTTGICLDQVGDRPIRKAPNAHRTRLVDWPEYRSALDMGHSEPGLQRLHGQASDPRAMAIVVPSPSWSVFEQAIRIRRPSAVSSMCLTSSATS